MGTNFYWCNTPPCPHCGRSDEPVHIGKGSFGWRFCWNGAGGQKTSAEWIAAIRSGGQVKDEYGDTWGVEDFIYWALNRRGETGCGKHDRLDEDGRWLCDVEFS